MDFIDQDKQISLKCLVVFAFANSLKGQLRIYLTGTTILQKEKLRCETKGCTLGKVCSENIRERHIKDYKDSPELP